MRHLDQMSATAVQDANGSDRRDFLKMAGTGLAAAGMLSTTGATLAAAPPKSTRLPNGGEVLVTNILVEGRELHERQGCRAKGYFQEPALRFPARCSARSLAPTSSRDGTGP